MVSVLENPAQRPCPVLLTWVKLNRSYGSGRFIWYVVKDAGVLRKKNLLLSIYSISILVYVVLFIVLGLFATLYPKQVLQSC